MIEDYTPEELLAMEDDNDSYCMTHPDATITEEGGYSGFAGGSCYWATLSCGCTIVDEDDDVRAAF